MSCCMRDAASLESRGIPTVVIVNDVFKPIAHATRALLGLPEDYIENNIVWLPHPTSNLSREAAERLIDERIAEIRAKLTGRRDVSSNGRRAMPSPAAEPAATAPPTEPVSSAAAESSATQNGAALETARAAIAGLTESLRVDGAYLELDELADGVLKGTLRLGELTCEDGSCIMPTAQLERMIEALVRPKLGSVVAVELRERTT